APVLPDLDHRDRWGLHPRAAYAALIAVVAVNALGGAGLPIGAALFFFPVSRSRLDPTTSTTCGKPPAVIRSPWTPLIDAFGAAVAAVEPGACVRRVLAVESRPSSQPHILAVGKAAIRMAQAAVKAVRDWEYDRAPGLVIAAEPGSVPGCEVLAGDHPVPGPASVHASEAIAAFIEQVPAGSPVWFLLSGGASSLMAAPEPPLTTSDLQETFAVLLRCGLDIHAMNSVRKRITRWGGGRLGRALARVHVLQIVISDVIGDDLAAIGSGPCVPDPVDTPAVIARLREARAYDRLPAATRRLLTDMAEGRRAETLKPGDSALERIRTVIAATNTDARRAAAEYAKALDATVHLYSEPVQGEASAAGRRLAAELLETPGDEPVVHVWGGETTVTVTGDAGEGGRCQELALAAAEVLAGAGSRQVALLAAGTDGRDGPTDAAGALVDAGTWEAIGMAGHDPERALERHDSYRALASAGALIRTGPTGTNVMDLMIASSGKDGVQSLGHQRRTELRYVS
ncbi:MAG TPA: DUF4147 domain-containing protein, partial [Gemmatimonadales bacterium]